MNNNKKIKCLRRFTLLLGWHDLRARCHEIKTNNREKQPYENVIRWYESGALDDIYFQINDSPCWCAAVYAIRFRICTGWHKFILSENDITIISESQRLHSLLAREWFVSLEATRRFRVAHPDCTGWTWKRLGEYGPPYRLDNCC